MRKYRVLQFMLALILAVSAGSVHASASSQSQQSGYFGTVSSLSADHPRAVAGETDLRLDTAKGPVEITATPATRVRIPGLVEASLAEISVGDSVAVLAFGGQAISIQVKPAQPVSARHFTGIVTAVEEDGPLSIRDGQGRTISVPALTDVSDLHPGDLVTAVLEQDLASGSLLITGLDRATENLDRILAALEKAQQSKAAANLAALRQRLADNSTRHLSLLQEVTQKVDPSLRPQLQRRMESAQDGYARSLARYGAGRPSARVSGIVASIDAGRRRLTIEPPGLAPVELAVTSDTKIKLRGKAVGFGQLDLANRVEARYELETHSASRITVLAGETLARRPARVLLATVDRGQVTGTVSGLDLPYTGPPRITIRDSVTNATMTLVVSPETVILAGGIPAELGRKILDATVTAIFDPESLGLIEIDTLATEPGQEPLSGVVHSFVSKIAPGNFSMLTRRGEVQRFTLTGETVIRRDGRRVSINEVRLGDLVRPNTRLRRDPSPGRTGNAPSTEPAPALSLLSLKSPPDAAIQGTIRGITISPQAVTHITISTNMLDVVSLLIDPDTELHQQGRAINAGNLAVGQRVVNGTYDPISGKAVRLVLQPPRAS